MSQYILYNLSSISIDWLKVAANKEATELRVPLV